MFQEPNELHVGDDQDSFNEKQAGDGLLEQYRGPHSTRSPIIPARVPLPLLPLAPSPPVPSPPLSQVRLSPPESSVVHWHLFVLW